MESFQIVEDTKEEQSPNQINQNLFDEESKSNPESSDQIDGKDEENLPIKRQNL